MNRGFTHGLAALVKVGTAALALSGAPMVARQAMAWVSQATVA